MKTKRVLVETTNTLQGCLEQGGICGLIESYPADEVAKYLTDWADLLDEETGMLDGTYGDAETGYCPIGDVLRERAAGRHVVRRGTIIE
ncbi:MAG: hypothetical protein BWX80_04234 [Candidatus Hydrogenedentes bacterium ADurb.Bin101]|nr:MAG: hypothetical protein BWX80_04234 [Candidatus Hydrogenedentes bacterium ADurb.Bin101]